MKKEYMILNLKKEYPGYSGAEKWLIITDLAENEFAVRYPEHYSYWNESVVLSREMGREIIRFKNNERKQQWRDCHRQIPIDEERTAYDHDNQRIEDILTRIWLKDSLQSLSSVQQKRIRQYYLLGYSLEEIAEEEGRNKASIWKSIQRGLAFMRDSSRIRNEGAGPQSNKTTTDGASFIRVF